MDEEDVISVEVVPEGQGYICFVCATRLGGRWPKGHVATQSSGVCPECKCAAALCSVGDYNWPAGSNKPKFSAGRD